MKIKPFLDSWKSWKKFSMWRALY